MASFLDGIERVRSRNGLAHQWLPGSALLLLIVVAVGVLPERPGVQEHICTSRHPVTACQVW